MKTIKTKYKKTEVLVNKCECGTEHTLKRCVWLDEAEDILDMYTLASRVSKKTGKYTLKPKYKMRRFYLAWCNYCKQIFLVK